MCLALGAFLSHEVLLFGGGTVGLRHLVLGLDLVELLLGHHTFVAQGTTFYRGWARKMKALALQPELLKDYPNYFQLKEMYDHDEDRVFY